MIDFAAMNIGDKVDLPPGKWNDEKREYLDTANAYCRTSPDNPQFQIGGHDGSDFEKGQYYIERIR